MGRKVVQPPEPRTSGARHRDPDYLNDLRAAREVLVCLLLVLVVSNVIVADYFLIRAIEAMRK